MPDRWGELIDILETFGRMSARCTLFVEDEVFDGTVGRTQMSGDEATVEIGGDVVSLARRDFFDFDLADPVPGYEYFVKVHS